MAKKTARPEMSWIESRKQWRKRIVLNGRSRDVYGKTQDEVRERVKELERQVDAGMVLDDSTTLVQFVREWFEIKAAGLRPSSARMYEGIINVHISPFFKNIRLADIKPIHVQKLMAQKPHLSRSQQTKILITIDQIMKSALENGLIARNPCQGIKAAGEPPKEKTPLTKEQQSSLVDAVRDTRAEVFVLLCLYAGLRREEALGLLWSNVHLDGAAHYIDVRSTVTFEDNAPVHSDNLKTKAARRSIPIPPILADALRREKSKTKSLLVIPSVRTGWAMSERAYERLWEIVTRAVPFHVHAHLLRHTYLTELCASGVDIKKIQYLAGHEDIKMTLKIYVHATQNTPQELYDTIAKVFPGSGSGSVIETKPQVAANTVV